MPAPPYSQLVRQAQDLNAAGLMAYGLLIGDPRHPAFPYQAVDAMLFDPPAIGATIRPPACVWPA
jgi:hypothetical protein